MMVFDVASENDENVGDLYQAPQNSFIFMRPEGFSVIRVGWVVPKVSEVHSVL